ncbi:unnamed protein product [Tuber melanosporum]|uniref:(Perigord truffle) hypothetical protein n=1 Tax=Tuber melanosporum (strain Mel28) TaxID=656061 RepID=D5GA01_TUBMM|nr:unnamed protein product [Tuber melanosporum]
MTCFQASNAPKKPRGLYYGLWTNQ